MALAVAAVVPAAAATSAGAFLAVAQVGVVPVVAAALLLFLLLIPLRALIIVAVAAMFFSRLSVSVADVDFRPEHLVTFVMLLRVALLGRLSVTRSQANVLIALVAFVVVNVASTYAHSLDRAASARVIAWLVVDVALFVVFCSITHHRELILRTGIVAAMAASALAMIQSLAATFAGIDAGVQVDASTGGVAAYGVSHEANILASSIAVWATIGAVIRWPARKWQYLLHVLAVGGILAAQTRAALVGYFLAIAVVSVRDRRVPRVVATVSALVVGWLAIGQTLALPQNYDALRLKLTHVVDFESGNGAVRAQVWEQAVQDLQIETIATGLGTNTFGQRHVEVTRPDTATPGYLGNLPLQILYDAGLVGVMLVVCIAAAVVRRTSVGTWLPIGLAYGVASIATSFVWFGLTWTLLALALGDGYSRRRPAAW